MRKRESAIAEQQKKMEASQEKIESDLLLANQAVAKATAERAEAVKMRTALQQEREQVQQRTKVLADQAAQLQETEIRHLTESNKLKKELATVQNARAVLEADKVAPSEAEMA